MLYRGLARRGTVRLRQRLQRRTPPYLGQMRQSPLRGRTGRLLRVPSPWPTPSSSRPAHGSSPRRQHKRPHGLPGVSVILRNHAWPPTIDAISWGSDTLVGLLGVGRPLLSGSQIRRIYRSRFPSRCKSRCTSRLREAFRATGGAAARSRISGAATGGLRLAIRAGSNA